MKWSRSGFKADLPVGVILADDMEYITFGKRQTSLLAGDVLVLERVVVEQGPESEQIFEF